MKNEEPQVWYDESGMADDWLRKNDPLWKEPKERDYLTARQYRTRAREKETPAGKTALRELTKKTPYRELVDIEDTERQIRKSEELVLDLE